MSYRIAQDFDYAGNDYWHWRAWIEAEPAMMQAVDKVVWLLHPSFKRTRITTANRSSGFMLKASGWGTFRLRAEVVLNSGESRTLSKTLKLEYPDDHATAATRGLSAGTGKPGVSNVGDAVAPPRTVFLSYSGEDSRAASRLRNKLEDAGIAVLDASRLKPGESWAEALRLMMAKSDWVIGLVTESEASPFVLDELQAAVAADMPAVALVPFGSAGAGLPASIQRLTFDPSRGETSELVSLIRNSLPS